MNFSLFIKTVVENRNSKSGHLGPCQAHRVNCQALGVGGQLRNNKLEMTLTVNREKQALEVDEELDSIELEELQDILPSHQPRFIVYSYRMEHSDGRISFPMCFIFYTPRDAHMELQVMYAGTQRALAAAVGAPRLLEVREIDELTNEWLHEKLQR